MLTTLKATLNIGSIPAFISFLSFTAICLGISIIITKNPILSILFLIALFVAISLYLIKLGLTFLGISYLLVYVGAISILFLFILMLINVRISELVTEGKNSVPLAIIAVLAFMNSVGDALPYSGKVYDMLLNYQFFFYKFIVYIFGFIFFFDMTVLASAQTANQYTANVNSISWDSVLVVSPHITSIGNTFYTIQSIFLIIISFILLLAMVGTIVITKKTVGLEKVNVKA